ncbi:aKG-HExxH-type peptide beta-hydroxylase [Mucilaginibacter sp. OK098]|uniref:aKG-HExxH-type peptide beta-hydroxylase n=1 Tax=Mucilaginibacter sp. OK098 TaxID=1855297 RepID=UPI00090FD15A|nr:HEXXH motif-containing putative peptide modification protein [Mucilaginibacter sp. OK098]SHN36158.1 HEXXH motif-containing protein [Mucilaginibacter sp. OK098]
MESSNLIADFIARPFPLWNNALSVRLVDDNFKALNNTYGLTSSILKHAVVKENILPLTEEVGCMVIALPSKEIQFFFDDHGLTPFSTDNLFDEAVAQIKGAIAVFEDVPPVKDFIIKIVKSIVILKAEDPQTDISYSHPDLPFSVFVSVCDQISPITNLRVAESILHEAMHLYLTLIEGVSPMISLNSNETFYSPWRDEQRPVRGVLHGLWVFKAILDFYCVIRENAVSNIVLEFIDNRIKLLKKEIAQVSGFQHSKGLTSQGQILAMNLLS